ncbi:MAG: hypothetical protein R3C62_22195 [Chloroflexota bacterium]
MNELHDDLLTQALESYPQAPLPPGFMRRVMAQIEPAPLPRFRLQFVDLAVPAFASLLLVTLILLAAQTDWLPLLLGGETAVFPLLSSFQPTPALTAVIMAVIGELALLVILCWGLWGDSVSWLE